MNREFLNIDYANLEQAWLRAVEDIHEQKAKEMFGKVTPETRRVAKIVNFHELYGGNMHEYKFKPGDRVHSGLGNGVVVAKNHFFGDVPVYAVQLDEWKPNTFSSGGIYVAQERFLSPLPQLCPTCHQERRNG